MMVAWRDEGRVRYPEQSERDRDVEVFSLHWEINRLRKEVERLERENEWLHDCMRRRPEPRRERREVVIRTLPYGRR